MIRVCFIRFLNEEDPLHAHALGYFKFFLEKEIILKVSTISIAEYCVIGQLEDLPLRNIQILPFNLKDAEKTGEFAKIIFSENHISAEKLSPRAIIPNESKLFAQADIDKTITHFVTSERRSKSTWALLKSRVNPKFEIINIEVPHTEVFGLLDL